MADLGAITIKIGSPKIRAIESNIYNYELYISNTVSVDVISLSEVSSLFSSVDILSNTALYGNNDPLVRKTIAGLTKKLGVNYGGIKVRVYDRVTGNLMAETVSNPSGSYSISLNVRNNQLFTVLAIDDANVDNASVADLVVAE